MVRTAIFLFAAGQETTAKLLGAALQVLGKRPDIQQKVREDRSPIPGLIEERCAWKTRPRPTSGWPANPTRWCRHRRRHRSHGIASAVNRDPRRFNDPHEFKIHRKNVHEHMAFVRGVHSCPGAPLARVKGRVSIEHILDRRQSLVIVANPEQMGLQCLAMRRTRCRRVSSADISN
ncbi:hypothetical protein BST14_23395 [Mycobacterium arosiense ATCC BAA-1401 = DSM 45069]|uniref:Cytochrome n=1 Tax=Mycobacterium arosiense ATCC BAA-1401 = DSM 45069 TaxID=1265311 RepID=A0A1W9Z8S2_MYCAI|nr:hypothetical protein BST14_23395 [Mycobacterium arosiense ATCC BAA-1401 = DSM 45069]